MEVTSKVDPDLNLFVPHSASRPKGLHISDVYLAMAKDFYPKWFKDYPDDEKQKQVRHFEKGLILEEAWGDVMANMKGFTRPQAKQVEGIWMSPDGLLISPTQYVWSDSLPELTFPSIHECKVTLKSSRGPITQEKFITWMWQVQAYCYGYKCTTAYIHVCHLLGDYGTRPYTPQVMLHRLDFTWGEIEETWDKLTSYARSKGML